MYGGSMPLAYLYGNAGYGELGTAVWPGCLERIVLYAVQGSVSIAFLSFIPWAARSWTDAGKRTVYVFLFHGLLLKTIIALGIYESWTAPLRMSLAFLLGAGLLLILSHRHFAGLAHPLLEPPFLQSLIGFGRDRRVVK
ncbi:hypothetical protein ACFFK0_07050 [Paenibacillus chartarius]|uniref:Uncharacterized protein n=1 Tax=Paenibacillus chartarius TaxID=747481 RepID=A0ABV6DHT9_9BACL